MVNIGFRKRTKPKTILLPTFNSSTSIKNPESIKIKYYNPLTHSETPMSLLNFTFILPIKMSYSSIILHSET